MHEFGIMNTVLQEVSAAAGGRAVCTVTLRVGPLSGVVPEALKFAFESLAPGGVASGARLVMEETKPAFVCVDCGASYETPVGEYRCPVCGSAIGDLTGGNEMELVSIEVKDDV